MASKLIRVHEDFVDIFGRLCKDAAEKIKKDFKLKELYLSDTTMSQLVAGKLKGMKSFKFKVQKCGKDKGRLVSL